MNDNHKETNGLSPVTDSVVHHINIEKEQATVQSNNETNKEPTKNLYEIPPGATTENLPKGVFYKVNSKI